MKEYDEELLGFNPEHIASLVGEEVVPELLNDYLGILEKVLSLDVTESQVVTEEIIMALHTLKSSSLMIGALSIGYTVKRVERHCGAVGAEIDKLWLGRFSVLVRELNELKKNIKLFLQTV